MKLSLKQSVAAACLVLPLLANAAEEILFSHAAPDTPRGAWCTSCDGTYRVWDQFDLSSAATITGIDVRLHIVRVNALEFSIWDHARTNQIFSTVVPRSAIPSTPVVSDGNDYFDVTAPLDLSLAAGSYFLSVYDPLSYLGWAEAPLRDGHSIQTDGGGGNNLDMVFAVRGVTAVPEPSAIHMILTGLAIGAAILRRRRRQPQG